MQEFWKEVYLASIRAGEAPSTANHNASEAIKHLKEKFKYMVRE